MSLYFAVKCVGHGHGDNLYMRLLCFYDMTLKNVCGSKKFSTR